MPDYTKLDDLIAQLQKLKEKHGGDAYVTVFDEEQGKDVYIKKISYDEAGQPDVCIYVG